VITHLEPDVPECEVIWALGSISTNKVSRGNGIPAELFQILKDNAVKVLHSICQLILLEGNAQNLQARLQQIINQELPDVFPENNTDFEEAQELEIKLPTFTGSWRKQGSSRKASTSASLTTLKSLTLWITTNCGKFLNR